MKSHKIVLSPLLDGILEALMTFSIGTFSRKQVQPCHCEYRDEGVLVYCNKTVNGSAKYEYHSKINIVTAAANVVAKIHSYGNVLNDECGTCFRGVWNMIE